MERIEPDRPRLSVVSSGSDLTDGARFWNAVTAERKLNFVGREILKMICQTMDTREELRRSLAEEGLFFVDRCGTPTKVSPCLRAELACSNLIMRLMGELGLIAPLQKRSPADAPNDAA
jgi:hypothetical protein